MDEMPKKNTAAQSLVRISRINDLEDLTGRLRASSNECVVLSEVSDSLDLDGLCIIPTKTIRLFDHEFQKQDLYEAALQAWPDVVSEWPLLGELSCIMDADLQMLIDRKVTVAIFEELSDPDVCYVGTINELTGTKLALNRITSSGRRLNDSMEIEIDAITKIEFASRYLVSINHAAEILAKK